MKQRLQGMVAGFLLATLLLSTVRVLASPSRAITVTYGVNIVVDGTPQNFTDDMMPFISEGRTFLPVRGIAQALGVDVLWDGATSTVYINSGAIATPSPIMPTPEPTPAATPIPIAVRYYLESDLFSTISSDGWNRHPENGSFVIAGVTYHRGFSTNNSMGSNTVSATFDIFGRGFARLSGDFGYIGNRSVSTTGSITVTDAESGRFLGGVNAISGQIEVLDVQIPLSTQRITIRMDTWASGINGAQVGLGDAFFETFR